jgi:hypothetical protein
MGKEALAEARIKAQEAQSAARLTNDPTIKKHWEQLAQVWLKRIAELEGSQPTTSVVPPLVDGKADRPPT